MGARAARHVWPRGGFMRGDRGAAAEQGSWEHPTQSSKNAVSCNP